MAEWTTQILLDGAKNCAVKITGFVETADSEWQQVVDFSKFTPVPDQVKIEHVEWAVTGRVELLLADDNGLLFPLASRGYMNFSDYNGGLSVKSKGGLQLKTQDSDPMKKGQMCFALFIDFVKRA